jgi:hypothetical protein
MCAPRPSACMRRRGIHPDRAVAVKILSVIYVSSERTHRVCALPRRLSRLMYNRLSMVADGPFLCRLDGLSVGKRCQMAPVGMGAKAGARELRVHRSDMRSTSRRGYGSEPVRTMPGPSHGGRSLVGCAQGESYPLMRSGSALPGSTRSHPGSMTGYLLFRIC